MTKDELKKLNKKRKSDVNEHDSEVKKSKANDVDNDDNQNDLKEILSPIAQPLAGKKLNKKLNKCVKKGAKSRNLRRGVKEVVKGIKKSEKGVVILAGNISPIDILTHIPLLCEESKIPYVYVNSKEELGESSGTKRPTSCMMVVKKGAKSKGEDDKEKSEEWKQLFNEIESEVRDLNSQIVFN